MVTGMINTVNARIGDVEARREVGRAGPVACQGDLGDDELTRGSARALPVDKVKDVCLTADIF